MKESKKERKVKYMIKLWKKVRKKEKWNIWFERNKERKKSDIYD